jgi:PST family polysaccharide transporter
MNKNKIFESVFSLGLVQMIVLATAFISLGYFSRIFDNDTLGKMVFLLSFSQLFVILSDYGFNLSATKDVSLHKKSDQYVFDIWLAVSEIKIIISTFAFIFYMGFFYLYKDQEYNLLDCAIAYLVVIGNILASQWLYQGLGELKFVSIISIFSRLIFFVSIFLCVKDVNDFRAAIFLQSAPNFIVGIVVLPYTIAKFKKCNFKKHTIPELLLLMKKSWYSFISVAAINVYTTSNVVFLGLLTTPSVVANYNLAEKIVRAMQAVYIPIANAMYPHMSHEMSKNQGSTLSFGHKFAIYSGVISFAMGCIVAYFSSFTIYLLFGAGYPDAEIYLKIIAFVPFLSILANVYGVLIMLPMGMEKKFSKTLLLAAILNVVIFYLMVLNYSGNGAGFANLAIEFFIFVNFIYFVIKKKSQA